MILEWALGTSRASRTAEGFLGTPGYLAILAWSMALVLFTPVGKLGMAALLCLSAAVLLYPPALRRILQVRWIAIFGLLILVNLLWTGAADRQIGLLRYSSAGLESGLIMVVRAAVILVAVDGFSSVVSISEVAGLLERLGMKGLGFAVGVAVNLLPELRDSCTVVWRSLKMRGGLRSRRWRALQIFLVTTLANALRRAEDIALAAEARAYSPGQARPLPLKAGRWDRLVVALALLSAALLWLL